MNLLKLPKHSEIITINLNVFMRRYILFIILPFLLYDCVWERYCSWDGSSYKRNEHKIKIDSAYLAKYGNEMAEKIMPFDSWIIDSIPYFYYSIEKKHSSIPIIPLFFTLECQRKKTKYAIELSLTNDKNQIISVDSVFYNIYDSLFMAKKSGTLIFEKNLFKKKWATSPLTYISSNSIDVRLKKEKTFESELKAYYTDINHQAKILSAKNIKLKYYSRNRIWCVLDI